MPRSGLATNHVDSFADMMMRRAINDFATEPVDFYEVGLVLAQEHATLTKHDAVLDVGCSSGQFIIEAAKAAGVPSYLIGLDPHSEPHDYFLLPSIDESRFSFMEGTGENIPLPDDAVKVVMAHNVLFRAADLYKMLGEMKRVTERGGLIIISTNAQQHARIRHTFERLLAVAVSQELGISSERLYAPAHGCYIEDIPRIVEAVGGLEVIDFFRQKCPAKITRGKRFEVYTYSLELSFNRLGNEPGIREAWQRMVEKLVAPLIDRHFERQMARGIEEPYFIDTVHRGLFVLRNVKL